MTSAWLGWSRSEAKAYARDVGLDVETFATVVASAQAGDRAAKIRLSGMLTQSPQAEGAAGPRALEALIEPFRTEIKREKQTALSIVPELAGLAGRVLEAGITSVERRAVREAATELLREAGIRGAHGLVGEALRAGERVSAAHEGVQGGVQGRALDIEDPEPWPEGVDGATLLDDLAGLVRRYVIVPAGAADLIALWVAHTYAMDAWEHTGYLAIISATKRCGKTTLLRIIEALVYRALRADHVTAATLFRMVERVSPTLVVDELDRVARDSDVWVVLNTGHMRGGAVPRCTGDDHEPRLFATFCPKVLAYVRGSKTDVPDTTEDRCIRITLLRRGRDEKCEQLRSRALDVMAQPLRRQLVRWAADHAEQLAAARPRVPEALDDRAADAWEPLFVVASVVGGRWSAVADGLAVTYSIERTLEEQDTPGLALLADLRELLDTGDLVPDEHGLAGEEMVRRLRELDGRPWRTWGRSGDGLTEAGLAYHLRPWARSGQRGPRGRRVRRYDPATIRDAADRYSPEQVRETRSPAHTPSNPPVSDSATGDERVSGSVRGREPGEDDDDTTPTGWPLDEVDL